MARYMIALLNGGRYGDAQLVSSAGITELHRGAADFRAMGLSLGQYGMGWFVDEIGGTKLVWHSGTNPDFATYMALLPEQKKGVVLLFNADHHWMDPVCWPDPLDPARPPQAPGVKTRVRRLRARPLASRLSQGANTNGLKIPFLVITLMNLVLAVLLLKNVQRQEEILLRAEVNSSV